MISTKNLPTHFELNLLESQLYFSFEARFIVMKNTNSYIRVVYVPFFVFFKKRFNSFYFSNLLRTSFLEEFNCFQRLLKNLTSSFNKIIRKKLILKGLGLRIRYHKVSKTLKLKLGFSHLILIAVPKTVKIFKSKSSLLLESYNPTSIGNFATFLREFRYPNSYTGKGIWFKNEVIKLKPVKKT